MPFYNASGDSYGLLALVKGSCTLCGCLLMGVWLLVLGLPGWGTIPLALIRLRSPLVTVYGCVLMLKRFGMLDALCFLGLVFVTDLCPGGQSHGFYSFRDHIYFLRGTTDPIFGWA